MASRGRVRYFDRTGQESGEKNCPQRGEIKMSDRWTERLHSLLFCVYLKLFYWKELERNDSSVRFIFCRFFIFTCHRKVLHMKKK